MPACMNRYIIVNKKNEIISIIGGENMTNVCTKLQAVLQDEANGILEYNKLKNEMPSEHKEHIETIEEYIEDEYKHLKGVYEMMRDMECPIEKAEEIEAKLKDISAIEEKTTEG